MFLGLALISFLLVLRTGLVYVGYLPVEGVWVSKPMWLHLICTVLIKWGFAFGLFGLIFGVILQILVIKRVLNGGDGVSDFVGKLIFLYGLILLLLLL